MIWTRCTFENVPRKYESYATREFEQQSRRRASSFARFERSGTAQGWCAMTPAGARGELLRALWMAQPGQEPAGRHPEDPLEVPREMGLIVEPRLRRGVGDRQASGEQRLGEPDVRVADDFLGELGDVPRGVCDLPAGAPHQAGVRVECPVLPDGPAGGSPAVHLAGIEHQHVARADAVRASAVCGQRRAAFGDGDHEFFVRVRRKGELDVTGAEHLQAAEGVDAPEAGFVAPAGDGAALRGGHNASVAPDRTGVQDGPSPPWYHRTGETAVHWILFYDVVDDYVAKRAPFRAAHLELARRAFD